MKNVFIWGLSGSGKDTISNYLRDNKGYLKLRIAQTIKAIICEKNNITFDELEVLKRTTPALREAHHEVADYLMDTKDLDKGIDEGALNRLRMICDRTALDFQMVKDDNAPIVVCDCRRVEEIDIMLKKGFVGIFLNRRSDEYANSNHSTEQNMFLNGILGQKKYGFPQQVYAVYNQGNITKNINDVDITNVFVTDGTPDELFNVVDKILFS